MMRRSTVTLAAFTMKYKDDLGKYEEDNFNEYTARLYNPARKALQWYAKEERRRIVNALSHRRQVQSDHHSQGLDANGEGPFEREMERKGVEWRKYPLTTTTGATRARELVILRRQALEEKAKVALDAARDKQKRAFPSDWYDEARGPLNPRFLRSVQSRYEVPIVELPRAPLRYDEFTKSMKLEE